MHPTCCGALRRQPVTRAGVLEAAYAKAVPDLGNASTGELCLVAVHLDPPIRSTLATDRAVLYEAAGNSTVLWQGYAGLTGDDVDLLGRYSNHRVDGLLFSGSVPTVAFSRQLTGAVIDWFQSTYPTVSDRARHVRLPTAGRHGHVTVWVQQNPATPQATLSVRVDYDEQHTLALNQPLHTDQQDVLASCDHAVTTALGLLCIEGLTRSQATRVRVLNTWSTTAIQTN